VFTKATKTQAKLRLAIKGPSGSGKTFSALSIAQHLGSRIAVIDTEYGSASKYAGRFNFDVCEIRDSFEATKLVDAMAAAAGYDVVIIDSLTHFWNGTGGILERVTAESLRFKGNSHAAWGVVTPIYKSIVHAILNAPSHVIVCLRAKQEYVQEKDERGKTVIKKVGMGAEIRDGFEYEMDNEGILDMEHNFVVGKNRCEAIDGKVFHRPGKELAEILKGWLSEGAPAPVTAPVAQPAGAPPAAASVIAGAGPAATPPADAHRAEARALYAKLPRAEAEAIRLKHGQDFAAMCVDYRAWLEGVA